MAGTAEMWWSEHAIMALVFSVLVAHLAWNRNWSWLTAAFLSQIPYWAGLIAFMVTGDPTPAATNAIFNVMIAGSFASIAEKLQWGDRGGIVHIWLCVLFMMMASVDAIHLIAPFEFYVHVQETAHYAALLAIGGRAYVKRIDGNRHHSLYSSDTNKGEDLA